MKITNHIIYTVPDSDSDSDSEQVNYPITPIYSEKQEKNLLKLGCSQSILTDYKSYFKNPNCYSKERENKYLQHQQNVKSQTESYFLEKRKQTQIELQTVKQALSKLTVQSLDDDKEFEKELEKQRKLIQEAIDFDKKKQEQELKQAKLKEEKELKEKQELEKRKLQLKEKKEQALKQKQSAATSIKGYEEYQKYYAKIEAYKQNIKPKLQQDAFRKQCFMAKRTINRTVTQLQSDHQVILEKFNVLHNHLMSIKNTNMDAFEVMLNHLAKVFLAQVKQEIHATNHAAYFLARFAYLMAAAIPEFLDYLLGRLMKRCPYLIPKYHDDDPNLSHDEIKSRLRYVYSNKEKKILETFLEHAEGQKCYVMFYGALTQTLPDPGHPPNPYGIKHAWIWLARICNMPPREITPFLVSGLLEVTAIRLLEAYPRQTPKLLRLIRETICPLYPVTESSDNFASIKRLEMFLDDYFSTGRPNCLPETVPPSV